MKLVVIALYLIMFPCVSMAEIYAEFGFEGGGETLASASDEDLNTAGGFKFAIGIQNFSSRHGPGSQ